MTYAMPEAELWQIAVFGFAVTAILVCGWLIAKRRK